MTEKNFDTMTLMYALLDIHVLVIYLNLIINYDYILGPVLSCGSGTIYLGQKISL